MDGASASEAVDAGSVYRVKPKTLENLHSQLPCLAFSIEGDSMETKSASWLVVSFGNALKRDSSSFEW